MSNSPSPDLFSQAQNAPKSVFGPGPAGGAYNATPDPSAGEYHSQLPSPSTPSASRTRRLRRLGSQAPSTQIPGYASGCTYLVGDAESKNTDAHPLDGRYFLMQFISIVSRYTVRDKHDKSINVWTFLIIRIKHLQPCYLETAGRVRVPTHVVDSVYRCLYLSFCRIVLEIEVQPSFVACKCSTVLLSTHSARVNGAKHF